jgi:DNA primase
MSQWVDFAELRAKISLEDVLFRFYGITGLTRDGNKLTGPCPAHGGDNPRAFHADLSRNIWKCFTRCGRGGNQVDFVVVREKITVREAALKLHAHFIAGKPETSPAAPNARADGEKALEKLATGTVTAREKDSPRPVNRALNLRLALRHDHPHLLEERKLALKTAETFGVGYCAKGTLRGSIAIPIHDENNVLVAYAGRRLSKESIEEHGKYVFPKGFRKDVLLYNYPAAKRAAQEIVGEGRRAGGIILVEGFFTVLRLYEAGFRNVVAVMGCELSDAQADLAAAFGEVVLLFDGDEAGQKGSASAKEKLKDKAIVREIHLPPGVKPDELDAKALRWALNGIRALNLEELSFRFRARK